MMQPEHQPAEQARPPLLEPEHHELDNAAGNAAWPATGAAPRARDRRSTLRATSISSTNPQRPGATGSRHCARNCGGSARRLGRHSSLTPLCDHRRPNRRRPMAKRRHTPLRTSVQDIAAAVRTPKTPQTRVGGLSARLRRRGVPHLRGTARHPLPARVHEARAALARARHQLDRGAVRRRPHSRARQGRLGRRQRDPEEEPRGRLELLRRGPRASPSTPR